MSVTMPNYSWTKTSFWLNIRNTHTSLVGEGWLKPKTLHIVESWFNSHILLYPSYISTISRFSSLLENWFITLAWPPWYVSGENKFLLHDNKSDFFYIYIYIYINQKGTHIFGYYWTHSWSGTTYSNMSNQ